MSTTASRPPASSSSAATSTAIGSRSRAAAPAATRRSPRWPSATCSRAGISLFGVGDLELLEADPHKFESHYDQRLVGPYPEAVALYRERSPVHFVDRISCPVLVIQGLDDRVVPPDQAEVIVAALAANGIPHAYLAFEGEGHGFRGAYAIRRTIEAEPVVPRPGLRVRAGRRHRADRAARSRRLACGAPRPPVDRTRPERGTTRRLMEISPIELVLGLFVVAVALAYLARRIGVAYPILLVLGGLALGFVPGLPIGRARPGPRLPAAPAADPVRGRLLHADPRLQGQRPADRPARRRARAVHHGRRRAGRPGRGPGDPGRGGVRPGRDRGAAGRRGRDVDLPSSRGPAPDRDHPRGREPDQRCLGADRLPVRGRGRDDRGVLARRSRRLIRRRRRSAACSSASSSGSSDRGLAADERSDPRDHASRCWPRSPPTCRPRRSASAASWPPSWPG